MWRELKTGAALDALKTEQLLQFKLVGWVPAVIRERDPAKGVLAELRDGETVWLESNKCVGSPERYTRDWDWRYQIQKDDTVDACDGFGHWYLSTVLATKTKARNAPSYEPILDKIQVGYRFYTDEGSRHDSKGRTFEGWSTVYDEWISVNSLRIQRPLSVCNQGAVYCKSQMDRDAHETSHASDILEFDDQCNVRYALERTDYESPYIIVKVLDHFCKKSGFEELYMKLRSAKEMKVKELVGVIKGLACIAPLIHKKYLAKQINGCYNELMERVNEVLRTSLDKEAIKMFVEASFMLSGLTSQLYTQRTKQEKMEQFLILLAKACLSRHDSDLVIMGEGLVEKLCYYKEYPFPCLCEAYDWIIDYVNDKPLFWKKLAHNFKSGFDYSYLAMVHLISLADSPQLKKWLMSFDAKAIVELLHRMKDVLPKNVTASHVNLLGKLKMFYESEEEIVTTANKLLWEFTNPKAGYTRVIVEDAKGMLPKGKIGTHEILAWALEDISEAEGKEKHRNVMRSLDFIHRISEGIKKSNSRETAEERAVMKKIFSQKTMEIVLTNFEAYYSKFKKTNIFPSNMLLTLEHKRLTPKGIKIHKKEVTCFLEFVIDYGNYSETEDIDEIIKMYKNAWDILVVNSALEEDAIQFYSTFADVLVLEHQHSKFGPMHPFRELFSTVVALYENPPKELPQSVLHSYLHGILFIAERSDVIRKYKILGKNMSFSFLPLKQVAYFPGIEFFFRLLEKVRLGEVFFEIIYILARLYYCTKEVDKFSELAVKILDVLHPMVKKGFTSGKGKLFTLCIETLDYIINAAELLGGYFPSLYELDKRSKSAVINIKINSSTMSFSVYSDASMRTLVRRIAKRFKVEYEQVSLLDLKDREMVTPLLYCTIEEFQKGGRLSHITANVSYENSFIRRGSVVPAVEERLEDLFERIADKGIVTATTLENFFHSHLPAFEAQTRDLLCTFDEEHKECLGKCEFVRLCKYLIRLNPKMVAEKLVNFDAPLDLPQLGKVRFWLT